MNDATVHIRRFGARHHVADDDARRRAMAVQRALLDGELEAALAPLAPPGELVLLRRLALHVTLSDDAGDTANARRWGEALGASLQRALQHARPDELLRFAGRHQAELAFVRDQLLGRQARDWAWQQLALLPAGAAPVAQRRRAALLRLLADEPERGVPLLRALLPTPEWPVLLRQLADGELRGMALSVAWCLSSAVATAWRRDDAPDPAAAGLGHATADHGQAQGIETAAPVRGWWEPTLAAAGGGVRAVWALRLACLLDAPALARHGAAAVDAQWRYWLAPPPAGRTEATRATASGADAAPGPAAAAPPTAPGPVTQRTTHPGHDPMAPATRPAPPTGGPEHAVLLEPALDAAAFTRCGGLLLLLPLLPACGALALLEDPALGPAAALPQRLHALALRLGAPGPHDAAALAFGALALHREPPPPWEPPVAQADVLDRCRGRLAEHLAERLPQWPASQRLARLLWRDAHVTVEPGWIDVRFALTDVSIDLRRAALDLDPGFLPWLGVVVRFIYE